MRYLLVPGLFLVGYMMIVEGEPGALPNLMVLLGGIGIYRSKRHRRS